MRATSFLNINKSLYLLFVFLAFTACNTEPRIDASSEENMQQSIAKIMKELNSQTQKDFEDSLRIIMFGEIENIYDLAKVGHNQTVEKAVFQAKIDGKTANEIIGMARKKKVQKELKKPAGERTGVPVSADDFLKDR